MSKVGANGFKTETMSPVHIRAPGSLFAAALGLSKRGAIYWVVLAVIIAVGGLVLFWFDPNRYPFYPVCAFHKLTGLWCPGCGSLRAMHQLLHGRLVDAFRFNPLLIAMLPVLAGRGCWCWLRTARGERVDYSFWSRWWWTLLVVAVVFTVWRNIPGSTFNALPQSLSWR
jgi:hypothetical protein